MYSGCRRRPSWCTAGGVLGPPLPCLVYTSYSTPGTLSCPAVPPWLHAGQCSRVPCAALTREVAERCVTDTAVTAGSRTGPEEPFFKAGKPGEQGVLRKDTSGRPRVSRRCSGLITLSHLLHFLAKVVQTRLQARSPPVCFSTSSPAGLINSGINNAGVRR